MIKSSSFWKEKYEELRDLKDAEIIDIMKEERNKAIEQLAKIKEEEKKIINFFFGAAIDSQNSSVSGEISDFAKELLSFHQKLEEEMKKRGELEKKIAEVEEEKKIENLSLERQKWLEKEIDRLKKLLEETNKKIEEWAEKIGNLQKRINDYYESLESSIENKEAKLKDLKKELVDKVVNINKNKGFMEKIGTGTKIITKNLSHGKIMDNKSYEERLNEFLEYHLKKATKYKEDEEIQQKKNKKFEKLRERTPQEHFDELLNICQLKEQIVELRMQLESAKSIINSISNVFNISQGHAFIGNQIGNDANFSYHNQVADLTEQISRMEINPSQK